MPSEDVTLVSKCEHCGKCEIDLNECALCGDKICEECSLLITAYKKPFSMSYQQCGNASTVWVGSGTIGSYSIRNFSAPVQGTGMGSSPPLPSPSQQKPDMIICTTCGDKLSLALRIAATGEKENDNAEETK